MNWTKYAVYAGAFPLYKPAIGLPVVGNASRFTNPISLAGLGGPRISRAVICTTRVFGIVGRLNVVGAVAFGVYDAYSIGSCAFGGG